MKPDAPRSGHVIHTMHGIMKPHASCSGQVLHTEQSKFRTYPLKIHISHKPQLRIFSWSTSSNNHHYFNSAIGIV